LCLLHEYVFLCAKRRINDEPKGSFGFHHLGLESKNSFMILSITYLAATELVIEFISNFMVFHLMPNLNTY
jgi:hypothetical protein